jgi:hypothetical protein
VTEVGTEEFGLGAELAQLGRELLAVMVKSFQVWPLGKAAADGAYLGSSGAPGKDFVG